MTWLRHLERPCFERERVWLAVQSHVSLYWGWLQMTMVGISWLGTLWVAWPGMWGLEKHEYSSCAGHLIVKTRTRTIPHTLVTHMYRSVIRSRHNIIMTTITSLDVEFPMTSSSWNLTISWITFWDASMTTTLMILWKAQVHLNSRKQQALWVDFIFCNQENVNMPGNRNCQVIHTSSCRLLTDAAD